MYQLAACLVLSRTVYKPSCLPLPGSASWEVFQHCLRPGWPPPAAAAGEGSTACAGQKTRHFPLLIVQVFIGAFAHISQSVTSINKPESSTEQTGLVLCRSEPGVWIPAWSKEVQGKALAGERSPLFQAIFAREEKVLNPVLSVCFLEVNVH